MKDPKNVWQMEDGKWYHRTEDEDLEGPFDSEFEAEQAMKKYGEWLNQPNPNLKK